MLRRLALPTGLLLLSSVASTQTVAPVTVAEADAALQRVDTSIRQVLKLKPAKKKTLGPNRAITRAEVVARMDEMFIAYQPQFQYKPRPYRSAPEVIRQFNTEVETQKRIEKLVRWGFLAPVGPVVAGPEDTLTIHDFAEAVGYFMSQTAALTYYADPRWVPNLQARGSSGG